MVIVEERGNGIHYTLTASVHADGDLVLFGHDLSAWLEDGLGRDEYEYFYTVSAAEVSRVRDILGVSATDNLLECVRDLLAPEGISASKAWKAWLKGHGISYSFAVR